MKVVRAGISIVMLICVGSFAQAGIEVGGGLNVSNLYRAGDYKLTIQDNRMLLGFNASWLYWKMFNDKMGMLAGISAESRGTNNYDYVHKTIRLIYVEFPVLFSYRIIPSFEARVGPTVGKLVSASGKIEDGLAARIMDPFQELAVGASLNMCYTFRDVVVVGVGYHLGLLNAMDNDKTGVAGSMRNSNVKISVAYKWTARPGTGR